MEKRSLADVINGCLLVVFAVIVGIACYYQPYVTDDVACADNLANNSVISSVVSGYLSFSGRILFLLLGTLEQKYSWLAAANGIIILALALAVVSNSFREIKLSLAWKLLLITFVVFLFWFGFCTLDTIVAWRSGSPYLWSLLISAVFILLLNHQHANRYLILIVGFCSGLMQEGISASLLAMVLLMVIYEKHIREKISLKLIYGAAGLVAGTILLVIAPGNYLRLAGSLGANGVIDFVSRYIGYFYKTISTSSVCLVYMVFLMAVVALRLHKNRRCLISLLFVISGLVSLAIPALTYSLVRRFTAIPAFFFLLGISELLALLYQEYRDRISEKKVLVAVTTFVLAGILLWDSYCGLLSEIEFARYINAQDQAISRLCAAGARDIGVPPIDSKLHRLVYYDPITFNPWHWKNQILAKHYRVNSIALVPPK